MESTIPTNIVIFYHGNCRDGFTAAWAAWKKLGDTATYIPLVWTHLVPDLIPDVSGKDVYFLDFCPNESEIPRILKQAKSLVIIDHHVSREELTKSLPGSVYDVNHSGGYLAWQYFHPNTSVPQICLYTEDSDIWKWSIPGSKEVLNYIDFKADFNFGAWDQVATDLEDPKTREHYEEKGKFVSQIKNKIISFVMDQQTALVNFEGYEVYATNAPRYFRAEIGMDLALKKPPFAIVWNQTSDEISVSLRSTKDFNLIPIAEKFGGGGHEHACNFRLPLGAPLPWKIIGPYHE